MGKRKGQKQEKKKKKWRGRKRCWDLIGDTYTLTTRLHLGSSLYSNHTTGRHLSMTRCSTFSIIQGRKQRLTYGAHLPVFSMLWCGTLALWRSVMGWIFEGLRRRGNCCDLYSACSFCLSAISTCNLAQRRIYEHASGFIVVVTYVYGVYNHSVLFTGLRLNVE